MAPGERAPRIYLEYDAAVSLHACLARSYHHRPIRQASARILLPSTGSGIVATVPGFGGVARVCVNDWAERTPYMVWFWTKDSNTLRLETRYDNDARVYVALLRWADGREETERFEDSMSFQRRLEELEAYLQSEHWTRTGPALLPDGWPKEKPDR
jgi:hypothetical protein